MAQLKYTLIVLSLIACSIGMSACGGGGGGQSNKSAPTDSGNQTPDPDPLVDHDYRLYVHGGSNAFRSHTMKWAADGTYSTVNWHYNTGSFPVSMMIGAAGFVTNIWNDGATPVQVEVTKDGVSVMTGTVPAGGHLYITDGYIGT